MIVMKYFLRFWFSLFCKKKSSEIVLTLFDDFFSLYSGGEIGVCFADTDQKNWAFLKSMNYIYNGLGLAVPCMTILIISILIIYRTCRSDEYTNADSRSFNYIAASMGIFHAFFNLPPRCSDILVLFLSPYDTFYEKLIRFNHEVHSFLFLSHGYKCFLCILLSRKFRHHAKSVLCFLIENHYEKRDLNSLNKQYSFAAREISRSHHEKHFHLKNNLVKKNLFFNRNKKNIVGSLSLI